MEIAILGINPTLFGSRMMGAALCCLCAASCIYLVIFAVLPRRGRGSEDMTELGYLENTVMIADGQTAEDKLIGISSVLGTRPYQQDRAGGCVFKTDRGNALFAVVCDGMGGMSHGERASEHCVRTLVHRFMTSPPKWKDIPSELKRAVRQLDREVADFRGENGAKLGSGTTLAAVCLRDRELFWASIGDSRIYLCENGTIRMLTRDHNYALQLEGMVRAGRITPEEAVQSKKKEALISYVGIGNASLIDVSQSPVRLSEGCRVLLCSDGVTKLLSDEDILDILEDTSDESAEAEADEITRQATAKRVKGQDNTTAVIMKCNQGSLL